MNTQLATDERWAMRHPADIKSLQFTTAHISPSRSAVAPAASLAQVVRRMKSQHGIRVKKWRRSMSGCAWRVYHADGRVVNWIEAPLPRTPISLAIFLHEVGHHVIGFDRYKKRCEEEYHVWVWALDQMRTLGIHPDQRVHRRFKLSMEYAVDKAVRRGLKALPAPLTRFLPQAA